MVDISEDYLCNICLQVLEKPISHLDCGKNFCANCLSQFLSSGSNQCPMCRSEITKNNTMENVSLNSDIASNQYRCKCGRYFKYSQYNTHSESCKTLNNNKKIVTVKPKEKVVNRFTFKCPKCDQSNLDRAALVKHFKSSHRGSNGVCPICTSMPWGDPNYVSANLSVHLEARHKMDYDTLTVTFI